jgi:hypothetical protein
LNVSYEVQASVPPQLTLCGESAADLVVGVKRTGVLPIKVSVCDANGSNVSSDSISVRATSLRALSSGQEVAIETAGQTSTDFRFDSARSGYILNLSTKSLALGPYSLTLQILETGRVYTRRIEVR